MFSPGFSSMDGALVSSSVSGGGGGGGAGGAPAPFLVKTYEMVDDSSTNDIVSWSANKNSFVVWDHQEFARLLLPTFFKHNNFSSFIRQLNTYGFRKIDSERWEFANEDFVKDQKHLLKKIYRRKPIHSHSQPPTLMMDQERATLEDKRDKLSHDKAALEAKLLRFKMQTSIEKLRVEELTHQVGDMENRQEKLLKILENLVQNPADIEQFSRKVKQLDISAYNKKRRLPPAEHSKPPSEISHLDNSSSNTRPEFGNIFQQKISNKLQLELSPAVSDMNLVALSIQSSNEGESPKRRLAGDLKCSETKTGLLYAIEAPEVADNGSCPRRLLLNDSIRTDSLPHKLTSSEETDGNLSCYLNLTLASAPLPSKTGPQNSKMTQRGQELGRCPEFNFTSRGSNANEKNSSAEEAEAAAVPPVRVNDVFWENFLTERPGSSDNEEASSTYRGNLCEAQDERRSAPV